MADCGNVMVAAALLVLANLLALHMPLVEALEGNLDSYAWAQLAHWSFDGTLVPQDLGGPSGQGNATEVVPSSDGGCCVAHLGFRFCINPPNPPPDCVNLCGVKLCPSREGEAKSGRGKFVKDPSSDCCYCFSVGFIGIKVCLNQGGYCVEVCGIRLCFSVCLDDSPALPAVPKGPNVILASDNDNNGGYIRIRQPGYLDLSAVHFNEHPAFTVTFSLRIPSYPGSTQILYADWSAPHWQFITTLDHLGKISVSLRRNTVTDGSDQEQGLLDFDSGDSVVPVAAWFNVAFQFDRDTRTGRLFLDQKLVGSATVRPSLKDADVVLMTSTSSSYQFGRKADTDAEGRLDADLRQLRIFGIAIAIAS